MGEHHVNRHPAIAPCPFCGSGETKEMAYFGSSMLTSQYFCQSCRTGFEYVRWRGDQQVSPRSVGPDKERGFHD